MPDYRVQRPEVSARRHPWDPHRHALRGRLLLGGASCLAGAAACRRGSSRLRPSFGMGADVGWLYRGLLFVGAGYNFGLLRPSLVADSAGGRKPSSRHHGVFGLVGTHFGFYRFMWGVHAGPGYLRHARISGDGTRQVSDGLAVRVTPSFDLRLSSKLSLGASVDFIVNVGRAPRALERANAAIFGLHLGAGFP